MQKQKQEIVDSLKISPNDVGSSVAQISVLSDKINNLTIHFKKNKNDKHSAMGLQKTINRRKRLLEYLKRTNPESYAKVLSKLNLRK